ncbi:MAG: flagellar hook protein FlgE [Rhodanobacter sp.]
MALNQALSGINAAQSDLNVIANNIANAGTTGFKGSRAQFADVFAVTGLNLNATAVGSGTRMTNVAQQFGQGDIESTGNALDLAISGNGFFTVNTGSGLAYTRNGSFQLDANNNVETSDGTNSKLQIYPPNGQGGFNTSTLTNLQLTGAQSAANPTSTITVTANLNSTSTVPTTTPFNPNDPTSYNNATTLTVYDSQGGAHQATVYYAKTANNDWNANLYIDGNSAGSQPLTFNTAGALTAPANGNLTFTPVQPTNGATFPASMTVNFTNTTQFGTAYAAGAINQNGYQAGSLSSVAINNNGIVTANYSNGQTAQLGQVAMANFANLQGLNQMGNTSWTASTDSGTAVMGTANSGQFGEIQSGSLESSNTSDTTGQLVDMIQAQRDYQANAQVLSTDNTLASTLFNAVSR